MSGHTDTGGKRKGSIKMRRRKTRRRRMRKRRTRCFEYAGIELKPERNWRADFYPTMDCGGLTADKLITLQPSHYVTPD